MAFVFRSSWFSVIVMNELPKSFWGEAMNTATFLLNLIPKKKGELCPEEKFTGKPVRPFQLHTFGEKFLAIAIIPNAKSDKLDERGEESLFMGYSGNGYRLYSKVRSAIFFARDVIFPGSKIAESTMMANDLPKTEAIERAEVPKTVIEALESPRSEQWRDAMEKEHMSLIENGTWELEKLPRDRSAVKCKWVFSLRMDAAGNVARYKARLVTKGFSQIEGIDYTET